MAEMTPLNIQIDEDALRKQIQDTLDKVLIDASWKLRAAADSLFPEFLEEDRRWMDEEVERRVSERLKAEGEKDD